MFLGYLYERQCHKMFQNGPLQSLHCQSTFSPQIFFREILTFILNNYFSICYLFTFPPYVWLVFGGKRQVWSSGPELMHAGCVINSGTIYGHPGTDPDHQAAAAGPALLRSSGLHSGIWQLWCCQLTPLCFLCKTVLSSTGSGQESTYDPSYCYSFIFSKYFIPQPWGSLTDAFLPSPSLCLPNYMLQEGKG